MTDPFDLIIQYKDRNTSFPAQLVQHGYSHKVTVRINDTMVCFEPDEEGLYRVVLMPGQHEKELAAIDRSLLSLLQEKLAASLK